MRSVVILCRHGNTFSAGEKVVMVGAQEDLPLTEHGLQQAVDVGTALRGIAPHIQRIVSGPLLRTSVFAEVLKVSSGSAAPISIDKRLLELDYGAWSGLSNEEIIAMSGEIALQEWQEKGIRPKATQFHPSEESSIAEVASVLRELENGAGVSVIVSSNGRLREFRRLAEAVDGRLQQPKNSGKVRTGGSCVLERVASGWRVVAWDCDSQGLQGVLAELK